MTQHGGGGENPAPSGTVTFLFSDVEGSTQRWDRDRSAMQEALRLHDRLMRDAIEANGGHVFKTVGDAFCAAFATPEAAAASAVGAQRALGAADFTAVDGLRVRMAINTGTADERDGDYFGPTVNRVARLLALGYGGQVLLAGIAADLVIENPPDGAMLTDLGVYALRDLERRERVYQLVAPDLQRDFPQLRSKAERPWLVPDALRTRYFTGRDDLLAMLRRRLADVHRAALFGLGGVGKSETALEYAVRNRAEYSDGAFWVNAENASGLTGGFVDIAKALRLPGAAASDHERCVREVLAWLHGNERWLLVLDNVEDRREVRPFVPETKRGDLLVTSRDSVLPELGIPRALEVRDLDDDEAVLFLLRRTGREETSAAESAAAAELAAELGNLPLALEQAAAYVAETNVTFIAYLGAFRKRRVALLERAGELVSRDTVAATWAANFEAVERASPAAADALRVSAFLAPDAVPFEIFDKGAKAFGSPIAEAMAECDDLAIGELLRPLARYSLIRSDTESHEYGVHRLVQEIVRSAIGEPERSAYVERTVAALDAVFPVAEFAAWAQCDRFVEHVAAVTSWVEPYGAQTRSGARVANQAARYLVERGRYAEARSLAERALAIGERALGPDDPEVASSLNNVAVVAMNQGRYAEAQSLHERALEIRERVFGPVHDSVASSLVNLANVLFERAEYDKAGPLYERALTVGNDVLGPDHPFVAVCLNNLGEVNARQGRFVEAESLHERALAIRERALGPDHPHVGLSLSNLADIRFGQNRLEEAESLYQQSLGIRERALGPDHREVAASLEGLARVRSQLGDDTEAERLLSKAAAIVDRAVGPDHPESVELREKLSALRTRLHQL